MDENIATLKQYIEKDIAKKSIDFFSEFEIDKSYILTEFKDNANKTILYKDILDILLNTSEQRKLAILGNGGQGKSQFLKILYKELYKCNKFPIYISLQDFGLWQKEHPTNGLQEYIKYLIGFDVDKIKTKVIIQNNNLINTVNKYFYLLLDGLDEYSGNCQSLLNNELFRNKLNFNILITSRSTCSMYLNYFNHLNVQSFRNKQILEYLQYFLEKQDTDKLYNSIKNKDELYALAKIPLFLALLCRIYKSNPASINAIHSKSDFIQQIFDVLCSEKLIPRANRKEILDELCNIAYNLKFNNEVSPSAELLRLQLLVPIGNTYQFVHKLFEDYYSALFIANNKTGNDFLDYRKGIYNIFSADWKQTIIFWFGIENVSDEEKIKCFNKILKFRDKTSGWYKKRAILLCCDIIGEYNGIPECTKNKLLNKYVDSIKDYYNLTDNSEVEENRKNKDTVYLLDLANVAYNTDRKCLCNLIYDKLKKDWGKRDNNASFTTYINILANLNYNTENFKNLLFEIYQERNEQYSYDLFQKAFKSCAYNDIKIIDFLIERIENPIKYDYQNDRGGWNFSGIIDILSDIIPSNSSYINKLYEFYKNKTLISQYGENKDIFTNKLKNFLRNKCTDENILKELGNIVSFGDIISCDIRTYLDTKDDKYLNNIALNIENALISPSIELRQSLKIFTIEYQKIFLKSILLDNRFIKIQKSLLCMISHPKYKENDYIIELFNVVKTNAEHSLYKNLPCLAYVTGMLSTSEEIISQTINILKEYIENNPNDFECINWIGHIALEHTRFKSTIIEFLKSIQYSDDKAKIYAMFYIDIDNPDKTQYKSCLMKLITDENKKDKRNDYLLWMYQNCLNCSNNEDLVNFSIKLIKSIPLKNILSRYFIFFIHHLCNSIIWNINTFKSKFENRVIKEIICFIGNQFIYVQNTINRKYFNNRFLYLDNWFIRNYITIDNQNLILKSIKGENYAPILCFLAYEMDYADYYEVYHPMGTLLKKATRKLCSFVRTFCIRINKHLKKVTIGTIILSILYHLFWITVTLNQEHKSLTISNYIHTLINKYTKDYK